MIAQSFEVASLKYLRTKTQIRLVPLVDADEVKPDDDLYGDGKMVSDFKGDTKEEYKLFYQLGVDSVFSDFADHPVAAR